MVADARSPEGEPGTVFFFEEDLQNGGSLKALIFLDKTQFLELNSSQVAEVFFPSSGGFLPK